MTETIFDSDWQVEDNSDKRVDTLYRYTNNDVGSFYITMNAREQASAEEGYKILALIYESSILRRHYLICLNKEKAALADSKHMVSSLSDLMLRFPKNIVEKQERILNLLSKRNVNIGENIKISNDRHYQFYAKNHPEMGYLLELMNNKKLITCNVGWTGSGQPRFLSPVRIEEAGWLMLERQLATERSKKAFIAMWFDESLYPAYGAMKEALETLLGFDAIRIDLKEHNNEISGEILYEIRQCRFLIADVTGQRQGVYFEAGFAAGLGIPVIWSCRRDHLDEEHFDTRQYNHVVWDDEGDLKKKLVRRVKGTIL